MNPIEELKSVPDVQSCYCPNCEAVGKELAALKAQPAVQCEWCNGRGVLAGHAQDGSFDGEDCPHCAPPAQTAPVQEQLGSVCADGGTCHHKCAERCFRRECCAPFSDYSGPWAYTTPPAQPAVQEPFEGFVGTWLEMGAPETFKNVTVKDMLIALQYFSAAQPAVPEGWKLVPARLTQNMADAAKAVDGRLSVWKYDEAYQAMLAAAPEKGGTK